MPLPQSNQTWPPPAYDAVFAKYAEWSAWYSGDPEALRTVYQRGNTALPQDKAAQYRRGVSGAIARFWWGRPRGDLTKRVDQLHIPIAADICQASADLLFSEPPTIKAADDAGQETIDALADDGLFTTLAEGAELAAALGGNFQRVTWDKNLRPDGAFIVNVDADGALPEFRWGQLVAVTFWWEVSRDSTVVWRHVERHELDNAGVGVILHGLYQGTDDKIGSLRPLTDQPATEGLADLVDEESKISTQSPGLAVEYFPNQTPQRVLRKHPIGRNLGRSDLASVEPEMDALDETWSSWMRDIRLGKSRIIVPGYMLQSAGRGGGAFFDLDQDVYEQLNIPPASEGAGPGITDIQFEIRVEQHAATAAALVKQILRTAGYSAQTFGEGESGGMKTATEVVSEQNRSYMTRDRKIRLVKPRTGRLLEKLLAVNKAIFSSAAKVEAPEVDFGDAVQADPEALGRTAQLLRAAQAASTQTLVAMQHPDWEQTEIDEEVARILEERSVAVPDLGPIPGTDTGAGLDQEPPAGDEGDNVPTSE